MMNGQANIKTRKGVELLLIYFWLRYDFMTLWNLELFYSLLGTTFDSGSG